MESQLMKNRNLGKRYFIECDCADPSCLLAFDFDDEWDFVDVHFTSDWRAPILERVKNALNYIFKNKPHLVSDSIMLSKDNVEQFEEIVKQMRIYFDKKEK